MPQTPCRLAVLGLATGLALGACAEPQVGLVDVTAAAGLDFVHDSGFRGHYYFPETMGSGVALVDLDDDGALDVYAVQSGVVPGCDEDGGARPVNRLWKGHGDGTFAEHTAASGAAARSGFGMGVCAGDVDGDARVDLFLTSFGPDALLLNRGALAFEERAAGTALADERWTTACGFGDFDLDGHLDLFVVGYVRWSLVAHRDCLDYCEVSLFQGTPDRVFKGDGRGGFSERTVEWGVAAVEPDGKGLGLALVDLDDDGDLDAYVANDTTPNHTLLNRGDGFLVDATLTSGGAFSIDGRAQAGMGVALADVDANGLPDLLVTNFQGESNSLFSAEPGGRFRDRTRQTGLAGPGRSLLGFGTAFADLDRDGFEDLVVTNGHVLRDIEARNPSVTYAQPGLALRDKGNGRFEVWDVGPAFARPRVGRGLALGDVDGDGAQDLVVSGSGEPLALLANRLALPGSSWLGLDLVGAGTNTLAVGARARLTLDDGRVLTRWVRSGTSYLSQDDPRPLFAIPPGARAGVLRIRWPDRSESEHAVDAFGHRLRIAQPAGAGR